MFHHICASVMLASVALSAWGADPVLKIRNVEKTDTVYSSTYNLTAVTDAGAQAWINGEETHVYRTGTFGAAVKLAPGLNEITVKVQNANGSTTATRRLFLADRKAPKQETKTVTASVFESPVHILTLPGAYLQYGNGDDRLGGSKMGYIAPDIAMTAVGSEGSLYKVALSRTRYAYIPKEYAKLGGEGAATVNTGSWSISDAGKTDRISVSLPERLPYYAKAEIDPSTLKVTLYGAMNNSNWITQRSLNLGIVDYVDFQQEESDVLTVVIRLKDKYQWGYSVKYEGTNLTIDVRHRPASLKLSDLTIGLDAGHGGEYAGAVSLSGINEKDVNLDIVLKADDMLRKKGAKVVLTRDGDTGPSMTERKRIWLEGNVDLAVSVHNNASGNPLVKIGSSAYYKHIPYRALAAELLEKQLELGHENFGLVGNFNFSLNQPTEYPNALVEVLFMSSLPEEELLADPEHRTRIAAKIVEGIEQYLKKAASSK